MYLELTFRRKNGTFRYLKRRYSLRKHWLGNLLPPKCNKDTWVEVKYSMDSIHLNRWFLSLVRLEGKSKTQMFPLTYSSSKLFLPSKKQAPRKVQLMTAQTPLPLNKKRETSLVFSTRSRTQAKINYALPPTDHQCTNNLNKWVYPRSNMML